MSKPYGLMADLHLHAWSAFSTVTESGRNSRLVGLLNEIERCASEVHEAGGGIIFFAGDIFHVRGSVSPSVLNSTRDRLEDIASTYSVSFIVMPGNHDLEGKESNRLSSAVTALEMPGVIVVSDYAEFDFGDSRVITLPWIEEIESLKTRLQEISATFSKKPNVDLLIHAPIDGVIKGLPNHGLSPEFLASLGFRRVFAGHYHNHKRFDGGVYSIGALAHHTWSDVGSRAGYLLVYPDRVDYRKSHLPEFIDLSQLADADEAEVPMLVDGNYVRVRVEASKTKEVEAARQELLDMGAVAVIVQAEPKAPVREGAVLATTASGASLEVSVSEFAKALPGVDAALVVKESLDILSAVDSGKE